MAHSRRHHRPSVRAIPIQGSRDALDVVSLAAAEPLRAETIALLLDDDHVGRACVVIEGTQEPDDVVDVAELMAELAERDGDVHAIVLASIRPPRSAGERREEEQSGRSDVDRWLELLDLFERAGIDLLDWYIVTQQTVSSLRSRTGMPPLWRDAC
jgi:hypothetical protein